MGIEEDRNTFSTPNFAYEKKKRRRRRRRRKRRRRKK